MSAVVPAANGARRRRQPDRSVAVRAGAKPAAADSVGRSGGASPVRRVPPPSQHATPSDTAPAPIGALAFATDPASERALREGLSSFPDAQVWPGDLRTAAAALGTADAPRVLFVDLDGMDYPAGAIHELATVCEVGTVVIALGSDDSARSCREILLAGVSDYLVKPVSAAAVRESAARVVGAAARSAGEGWLVGFVGTGGNGTTTVAAATTLVAAQRGRYVSVLDLNRTFSALSFLLDVEPSGGLVDLLSTVARASLHPEMVDGMRAVRSDRIAVYGYPWSPEPPPLAPVWAVCELLVELQRRSHLVIVDGMDDPATRQTLLAMVDARVVVVEPTATGAAAAARMMARIAPMLDQHWPVLLVQNHTRAFGADAGARALDGAGVARAPDVLVPFEPTLPSVTDQGWPQDRLPRTLREPLDRLVDRILAMSGGEADSKAARPRQRESAVSHLVRACGPRPKSARAGRGVGAVPGTSLLRRFLPPRFAGPRPA